MAEQLLTVFVSPETHEMVVHMKRDGEFEDDDHLIRDALHALKREWDLGHGRPAGERMPQVGANLDERREDPLFQKRATKNPEDYDT
jgi:hypothetical protein